MRLGLCCAFVEEPIRFRTTTARWLGALTPRGQKEKLRELAAWNAAALEQAIRFCIDHHIGSFRVTSQILPLRTHPQLGYSAALLGQEVQEAFRACGELARTGGIRLTFHPDQFVVLSSPRPEVVESSLREIEAQAEVAGWIGAGVINIHAGGVYGHKPSALSRLARNVDRLSPGARALLTLENDDVSYTPRDLLPVCAALEIPLVYDVHHHRCNGDGLTVVQATAAALGTWDREPLFHVSSPREGWRANNPRPHAEWISLRDFPRGWQDLLCTVEVEAKQKELAVGKLARALVRRRRRLRSRAA